MSRIFNVEGRSRRGGVLLAAAAALGMVACSNLLDVKDVDVTAEQNFVDATSIPALQASAIGDFMTAYEDMILYTGVLADEWVISGTFPTRIEVDQRDIDPGNATLGALFPEISRARAIADFADQRIAVVDTGGTAQAQQGEVRALAGLSLVLMTEAYCEGTPISHFDEAAADPFQYGGQLTREQVLDTAISHFNAALAVAPSGSSAEYLARVGLGRALMDRGNAGDYDAAAAAVATVPTTFLYQVGHDAQAGQNNNVWSFNINQERWSVANLEGTNGLPFRDAADPRVLWNRTPSNDTGFDRRTPSYNALKYSDRPANTPVADGVEARLIEAEAALAGGDANGMLTILNGLRSQVRTLMPTHNYDYTTQLAVAGFGNTLAPLALPATYDEQVNLLFQERAYWLWLTAHRLGDLRRLIRQYGRTQDQVFPVGLYAPNGNAKGGSYGTDVNFPIPVEEANNPNTPTDGLAQCLNRGA
jgi:hypothetical protein